MGRHPQTLTPHMTALMERGVRFTHAYSNDPICAPSRASFLTGLYPHTTGYFGYDQQAHPWRENPVLGEARTIMEHFSAHGYDVFGTGKVFHNDHEDDRVWRRPDGFDGLGIAPSFGPFPWDGTFEGDGGRKRWSPHPATPPPLAGHWEDSFGPLSRIPAPSADSATAGSGYEGWILFQEPFRYDGPGERDPMPDELNAAWADSVLRAEREDPFLLVVGFNRPHTPLYAPQEYFDRFPLDSLALPEHLEGDLADCPPGARPPGASWTRDYGFERFANLLAAGGDDSWREWVRAYLACVAFVDDQIGRVLASLEASSHADDTVVVLTSDHGYVMGEKEYLFKNALWETSTRVPLVIVDPRGGASGAECTQPVSLIDLYPTLVDYGELPPDPNRETNGYPLDGHSLRPLVDDPETGRWAGPEVALMTVGSSDSLADGDPARQHYAVRSTRHRYVRYADGAEELYDHQTDPREWVNLAGDPAARSVKDSLRVQLLRVAGLPPG